MKRQSGQFLKGSSRVNLFVIAFRNLSRHKVKSIITVTAVAVGVTLYIFMDAWLLGMNIDSQRNIINFETGSIKIYNKAFFEKKDEIPTYENFKGAGKIVKRLQDNGWNAAERVVFTGSLISPEQEIPAEFIGIDIKNEQSVLYYQNFVDKGRFIQNGEYEILIGSRLARNLKVLPGDRVRLNTVIDKRDDNGTLRHINQLIELTVAGIINSPNPKNNSTIGNLPLDILQNDMGLLLDGAVTEIIARKAGTNPSMLSNARYENKKIVYDIIGDLLTDELMIINWQEDVPDFFAAYQGDNVSTRVMIFVLFLLAFLGIANTMLMAVLERTKEIGMMRSMGMTDFSLLRLFFYEAGFIGLIGSGIGMLIGVLINIYMVNVGIDYTEILNSFGDDYGYRVVGSFKSAWNYSTIFYSVLCGTIISAFTALPPVYRTLKTSIIDSLRFE